MFLKLSAKTYALSTQLSIQTQIEVLLAQLSVSLDHFNYFYNGKKINSFQNLQKYSVIHALVPLVGGKGGYGAKLKTEGGKKVRPNDNMFSRDTNGQKLVYTTMERQFKEFVVKKIQEDKKVTKERQLFKIMQSTLKQGQSFMKLDRAYKKQIEETQKNLSQSLLIGKKRFLQNLKAKQEKAQVLQKKEKIYENEQGVMQKKEVLQGDNEQEQKEYNLKRSIPQQFKENDGNFPEKKIKIEIKPQQTQKPKQMSAQQKFKLLFKK